MFHWGLSCNQDDFQIEKKSSWQAKARGVCLVTEITAQILTPSELKVAIPYKSSGTSYSTFTIGLTDKEGTSFKISRGVPAGEE